MRAHKITWLLTNAQAEDKMMKRAAEAAQLLREDTPMSVASEADASALRLEVASQGVRSASDVLSDAGEKLSQPTV